MRTCRLVGLALGLALFAGQCLACGWDPCERYEAGFAVPCQHPDYIAPEFGDKDFLRILLTHYLQLPASSRGYGDKAGLSFSSYQQQINNLLAVKHLPPLELANHDNSYYRGTGGCRSNSNATALELARVVSTDRSIVSGYRELFTLRNDIIGWCGNSETRQEQLEAGLDALKQQWAMQRTAAAAQALPGKPAPYPDYLEGLIAFYGQDYPRALEIFAAIGAENDGWLGDTSSYLLGRIHLIAAQQKYNGWDRKGLDQQQLVAADQALTAYLQKYPRGFYADSATGLKRRVLWFQQNPAELNAQLLQQLAPYLAPGQQRQRCDERCQDLAIEFFNEYKRTLPAPYQSPLIAAYTLMTEKEPDEKLLAELESQRAAFNGDPNLYQLTRNVLLYRLGRYQQLVDSYADADTGGDDITVGNQVFFARALEQLQQYDRARSVWRAIAGKQRSTAFTEANTSNPFALQRPAKAVGRAMDNYLQVALARNYLLAGDVQKLAAHDSGITDPLLLENSFNQSATSSDLKAIIVAASVAPDVRKLAQSTLMNRLLFEKRYSEFVAMVKQLQDPDIYPQVQTAATMLQENPDNPKGLLNLGYFLSYHRIMPQERYDAANSLTYGFAPQRTDRPKNIQPESPFRCYQKALAQFGPQDRDEDEAKLLYYLILSFKQSNDSYYTTWGDAKREDNKGKEWFDRLKSKYPKSKWAKKTKYYY